MGDINKKDGFKFIGISVQTTNKDNQAQADLGKLWGRFYSEQILDKIPNKASNEVLAIYTNYKSNYTEDYTTLIGVKVSSLEEIPEGCIGREFEAENFRVFKAKGEMPTAVVKTWLEIWERDEELKRRYSYDYEVYGEKSQNGKNSELEIYIAID